MTQDKHSPLPWAECKDGAAYHEPMTIVKDDQVICGGLEEENAAFIIRACNNHYQLIEALEAMINAYGSKPKMTIDEAEKIGLKALSNAKGDIDPAA